MRRGIMIAMAALVLPLAVARAQDEETKSGKLEKRDGPPAAEHRQDLEDLRDALQDLREQERELRRQIARLERSLEGGGNRADRRPRMAVPRLRLNDRDLDQWRERVHDWASRFTTGFDLGDLRGQGRSFSLSQGPDGVRVEVTTEDEDGNEKVEKYEAESLDALKKEHPELVEKYGLHFSGPGRVHIDDFPKFGMEDFETELVLPESLERLRDGIFLRRSGRGDRLGVMVEEIDDGLKVVEVEEDSLASTLGILEGDVITSINGRDIEGVGTVRKALRSARGKGEVAVSVRRGDETVELKTETKTDKPKPRKLRRF